MPISDKQLDRLRAAGGTLSTTLAGGLLGGGGAGLLASQSQRTDETPEARKARIIRSIITGGGLGAGAGLLVPTGARLAHGEDPSFFQRHSLGHMLTSNPITLGGVGLSGAAGLRARGAIIEKLREAHLNPEKLKTAPTHLITPPTGSPEKAVPELSKHLFEGGKAYSEGAQGALSRAAQGRVPWNVGDIVGAAHPQNFATAGRRLLKKVVVPEKLTSGVAPGEFTGSAHKLKAVFDLLKNTPASKKYPISLLGMLGGAAVPAALGYGIQKGVTG